MDLILGLNLMFLMVLVNSEMSVKHVLMTRKVRSNSGPIQTGYVYTQSDSKPASFSTYGYGGDYDSDSEISKHDNDMERLRSLSNYELSKNIGKTNAMFDSSKKIGNYDFGMNYQMDDEDVRTNSRNLYDSWPYHYNSPYEYMYDVHSETVKDKRYVEPSTDIKPVHEFVDEEMPNDMTAFLHTDRYLRNVYTTPIPYTTLEHLHKQPYSPHITNDYYDKTKYNDEDTFTFKGLDSDYFGEVNPRHLFNGDLDSIHYHKPMGNSYSTDNNGNLLNQNIGKYVTEKSYNKKHEFDKHNEGKKNKEFHKGEYENGGQKHNEYKNIVDAFGNKFDSGNTHKDAKYNLENNSHKGEKKKGFHRVYHKNEYQEDNEFFDNNEKKANALENAGTSFNAGHSNGLLHAQAAASLGNEDIGFHNIGGVDKEHYDNSHSGYDGVKGLDVNSYANVNKNVGINNFRDHVQ